MARLGMVRALVRQEEKLRTQVIGGPVVVSVRLPSPSVFRGASLLCGTTTGTAIGEVVAGGYHQRGLVGQLWWAVGGW